MRRASSRAAIAGLWILALSSMTSACPPPMTQVYVSGEISGVSGVLDISGTVYGNISSPTRNPPPLVINMYSPDFTKYGAIRWTGGGAFGSGGTLLTESTMTVTDNCCKWHSIRSAANMEVWVLGAPGTRYKLRRTTSYSSSRVVSPPSGENFPDLGRLGSFSPPPTPAGGEIHTGRTSSANRIIGNKVYSLAATWSAAADTRVIMGYGGGGTFYDGTVAERRGVSVDPLTPDPITFVLTIGVRDNTGGWHRGDLGAAAVADAFSRCQTSGTMSQVQVSRVTLNLGDGDGTQVRPAIENQVAAIRALAMPGDTLVVYWESHGFSAPTGPEPMRSWNLGPDAGLHPDIVIRSTGYQHLYMHAGPHVFAHPQSAEEWDANAAAFAQSPGNLSEVEFANLFRGGVLDCMNKLFVGGSCFADGFWSSLGELPRTAMISPARIDGANPLSYCRTGGVANLGRDFRQSITRLPCPLPGEAMRLDSIIGEMQAQNESEWVTHIGPTFRLGPLWWDRPIPGVVPLTTYSLRANRTFASSAFQLCLADVVSAGGVDERDGRLTADDLIAFLEAYFSSNLPVADVAKLGGMPGTDGQLTADDLILYVSTFLTNCQ